MNISNPPDFDAKFEGFFLQMVVPGLEQRCQEIVTQSLGNDWKVKAIGDNLTEFEITPNQDGLSVKEAWDKTYYLRSLPGVVDAEPLFAVPITERSDWEQESRPLVGGLETKALALSSDLDWSLKQLRVFETWARFFPDSNQLPGDGIIIGHPDTGYSEHPEIFVNLLPNVGYDFLKGDRDAKDELETPPTEIINNPGHGTSTASVIISPKGGQASYPSGKAVTGVAPGAKLIPLRVSYSVVLLSVRNLAEAIEYAANQDVHVISISLGTGFSNQRLRSAIIYAQKRGVIIVAASGTYIPYVVWPAAYDEVIAVTGSNVRREIWIGSSTGIQVDVTAPAESVWFAKVRKKDGAIQYNVEQGSGTSFSAPFVAGVAALWLAYHGRDQLIQRYGAEKIPFIFNQILRDSCDKFPTWKPGRFGEGIVNAEKLLAAPLPDNVTQSVIAPGFALSQHSSIDNGINTFAHLFEPQLLDTQPKANFVGTIRDDLSLQSRLAQLLHTTETELPKRLKEVGQELAFYLAATPELYKQFAASLRSQTDDESSKPINLELLREMLLSQGVSEVLKTKLGT
ncbi:MAG: S8 family serine peptidase [Cyanomargarita calcarea GSE-NOS-MK-12-04C]|jgi:subtilisin family serine protease|uniref:S8 family serine peptidase n=1 Tax=Cyanomargarita calcarea GSE-NOS-MK-12-04C TaxID=2839659 RepID=A0A951QH02_9CYAN|nr:S8 family serine peptidase [Cyanomargarita calcarea GSE-NOS-MK-12-04C]